MGYELAGYDPALRSQLIDLRGRVFGGSRTTNERIFAWKYERNPYLAEPLFTIAMDGDRVVAMCGFYGGSWIAGGATALIPSGAETAIVPEHRGRWLILEMMRFGREHLTSRGFDYAFHFSANETVRVLSARQGWQRVAPYRFAQLMPNQPGRLAGRVEHVGERIRGRLGVTSSAFVALQQRAFGGVVVSAESRPEEMAALVELERDERIGHARDAAYYRWRFEAPVYNYRFLYLENQSGLDGFAVLQQSRGGGVVSIVDWCARSKDARMNLWRVAVGSGEDRLQIWTAGLTDEVAQELASSGFQLSDWVEDLRRPSPAMMVVGAEPLSERWQLGGMPLLDSKCWDLRMLYSDSY